MNQKTITCSLCGFRFDPAQHLACSSCPLQKGCLLVCCPNCGYETVNANQSALARLAVRWLTPGPRPLFKDRSQPDGGIADEVMNHRPGL